MTSVEAALRAIEEKAHLNAVITVCAGGALARARDRPTGVLAGVPLLVKDLFDTAGVRTTYGSSIYAEHVPARTAPTVALLEEAGAVVVGKANLDEFAWGVTGQNAHWGDVGNPRCPGRIAGGSSAGSAAGLAAGLCDLALGSDTGGSVRMPSACCGTVGFKPSLGKIPTEGCFPLCPSFDTVGPMARSVQDCALAYSLLTGEAVPAARIAGRTVGVLTRLPAVGPSPDGEERDERALAVIGPLEMLGARVLEVELPVPEADIWPLFYAEAAASHRATFPARRDEYGPTIRAKLDDAQGADPASVEAARRALSAWRAGAAREPDVDLFLSPTLGVLELPPSDADELEIRRRFSAYTRVFSFLGWPAIAIGELQLAGRDDATVLAAALAWESAYGSRSRP
jgi:aspartyl-tRNA(Asn)/glutamyl-tRNA(Gln) amidotransferase subunit A